MTPDLIRAAGESLYGDHWQSALARDLGVNDRTMRRWAAGTNATPYGLADDLRKLLVARQATIAGVLAHL